MIARTLERRDAQTGTVGIATNLSPGIPGLVSEVDRDGLGIPAWWAGVRIIASTVAMVPLEVRIRSADNVVKPYRNSRLWDLLGVSANPENSAGQVWEFVVISLLMHGNAYLWKERDADGRVVALWPIRPNRVQVTRDPRTRVKRYFIATASDEADYAPIRTNDVLHVRGPGLDPLIGWSPLRYQRDLLVRSRQEGDHQKSMMDNGVTPSGVLEKDGPLQDETIKKLARQFDSAHSGPGNAGKTIVLEEGLSWKQVSMSAADAQFLQQRQFTRQEIAVILDLPAHRVLAGEGGGMHYSSAQMDMQAFAQQTIMPWTSRIERALVQDKDLPWAYTGPNAGTLFPAFDIDVLANADPAVRYANYESAVRAKWIKPDEIRSKEGEPPSGDPAGGKLPTGAAPKATTPAPEGPPE